MGGQCAQCPRRREKPRLLRAARRSRCRRRSSRRPGIGRERFDRHDRRALVLGGEEKGVEGAVPTSDVPSIADEPACARRHRASAPAPRPPCALGHLRHDEDGVGSGARGVRRGSYEVVRPLDRGETPGVSDDEGFGPDVERCPPTTRSASSGRRAAKGRTRTGSLRSRRAVRPELDEVVAHLVGDGDDRRVLRASGVRDG